MADDPAAAAAQQAAADKPEADEDTTPVPTQAQLDDLKLGRTLESDRPAGYKTRAARASG